ncbi:hypothetical protein EJB05_21411, partial [Eragrostis curvula]
MSAENSRRRVSFRSDLIDIIDDEMEPPVHYDSEMEAAVLYDVPRCEYPCSRLFKARRDVVRYDYGAPGTSRLRAGAGSDRLTRVKVEPDSQDARCDVVCADDDSVAGLEVCSYRPKRRHSVAFGPPRRQSVSARLAAPPPVMSPPPSPPVMGPPPSPPVMGPPPPIPVPGSAAPARSASSSTRPGAAASARSRARHDEMLAYRKARKHVIVKASKSRSAAALPGGSGSGAAAAPKAPPAAREAYGWGMTAAAREAYGWGMTAAARETYGWGMTAAAPKAPPAALETYGRDMTAAAGGMDPVIGRDGEIDRVVCILCRRTKNSAVLVGAPGVGKTAIAEGLAQRVAAGEVPAALSGARVVELDLGAMVAGTTYRGMFEERVKKVIQEAEDADGKVILFIDEMHMLLGAGRVKDSSMDAANLLKSALARGRIRCVGATTFDEHRKHVERDPAFERRFQKVPVEEPSLPATIAILQGLKKKYEEHHNTTIEDAAIVAAARLAKRYITDRQFPDKAIDLLDEACTITRMQTDNQLKANNTEPTPSSVVNEAILRPYQVAQVVSRWTGIPVNTLDQNEKEKLMHLADRLQERVVGQEEAVNLVAQAVLRSRAGMDEPGQPIGSFLFLGSTGVGKTELAKALAEQLFDSEKMLIRFDMTEFVDTHSVLRLIGAPPSYRGHEDGGQLTEKNM